MNALVRSLVREPVCHFLLVGVVLFGVERTFAGREDAARSGASKCPLSVPTGPIVVDAQVRTRLAEDWQRSHGEAASAAELAGLVDDYVEREVLYREGLRRGLADGDARIQSRVVAQMRYVLGRGVSVDAPDEAQLRAWFTSRREAYVARDRVDFSQVFVRGRSTEAEARAAALIRQLDGGASPNGMGDAFSGGRRFRGRRLDALSTQFGEAFAAGLKLQAVGSWSLLRSDEGLHIVRVDRWVRGNAPDFAEVRDQVAHDWEQAQRARAREDAAAALRRNWQVVSR
ncbi:MAG: peptidylprolyl isomerase [Myxococcota bacterium]